MNYLPFLFATALTLNAVGLMMLVVIVHRIQRQLDALRVRPATDEDLAEAAAVLGRIDPSRPWRQILHEERRRP